MESFEQWNEVYYGDDPGQKDLSSWAKANWRRPDVKVADNVPGEQPEDHEGEDIILQLDAYSVSEQQSLVEMIIGSTPWLYTQRRTIDEEEYILVHKCHVFNVKRATPANRPEGKIMAPPYSPDDPSKVESDIWGENLEVDVVFDVLDIHGQLSEHPLRPQLKKDKWIKSRSDGLLMMIFGLEREVAYTIHTRSLVQWTPRGNQ